MIKKDAVQFHIHQVGEMAGAKAHFKCVQLSDLHLKSLISTHEQLLERVNHERPDLLLITGDITDQKSALGAVDQFLARLGRGFAKAAILGNWEYQAKVDICQLKSIYEKHGVDLLVNDLKLYAINNRKVLVSGLDDLLSGAPDPALAMRYYQDNDYHILLHHCPAHRDKLSQGFVQQNKVDLILAGHTHGGQVNILGATLRIPGMGRYLAGWYKDQHPPMFVSKGIGTSLLPFRLGVEAQVDIFEVYF